MLAPQILDLQEQIRDREHPCPRQTGNRACGFRSRKDP
jgi:hypothetical protein